MDRYFKDGQVVLFQGDSITDCKRDREGGENPLGNGYPKKIAQLYDILYPGHKVTFVNKGISGNRVVDLLARYDEEFKGIQPDFISILIGINDTWRRYDNNDETTVEKFYETYHLLLSKIKKDLPNCKLMIIEPFLLNSLPDRGEWRKDLDPKIHAVRKLAIEFADYYLPLDGILAKAEVEQYTCIELAEDGVHPTDIGHSVIAKEYLKVLK